jgi:SAM-dependent methyltransferase
MGWAATSADPNSAEAHAYRNAQLREAHKPPIRVRGDFLVEIARGRRVLDVGCVDHLAPTARIAPLHRKLAAAVTDLVGVDIQPAGVEAMNAEGYTAFVADVTEPGLSAIVGDGYEVMIAGELIEHLLDLTPFFANARTVLRADGRLVLTTPNPHSIIVTVLNMMGRTPDNVDHVAYHWPSGMAEIADRCGFSLLEVRGVRSRDLPRKLRILELLGQAISRRWPTANAECESLIYTLAPRAVRAPG